MLTATSPQKDVRAAYRKRAKQFHPDLHPNDPKAKAKFQALSEAFEVIGDPDKRAKYDKYGEQWRNAEAYENAGGFGGFQGGQGGGNPFGGFDFSSFGNWWRGLLAASSKTYSEAVDVAVHLDLTRVEHMDNSQQDRWRLMSA